MKHDTTKSKINRVLKELGIAAEIERGAGYWYFHGDDIDPGMESGVYGAPYLHEMSVDSWVKEASGNPQSGNTRGCSIMDYLSRSGPA